MRTPSISVVVVGFDMARELPRTVISLLPPYQIAVEPWEIEIIVVDNGSAIPISREMFPADADIKLVRINDASVSPCHAINLGVTFARAVHVAVMVDGARMASPGIIRASIDAVVGRPKSFVATLGFHLGPTVQQLSITEGYTQSVEDKLLDEIAWPSGNGYRLFEICALGESYRSGVLVPPTETTFFVMQKQLFESIGGYNENFRTIGGGFAGFEFFRRAVSAVKNDFVMLIGEGTFHQLHFGATTRAGGVRRKIYAAQSLEDLFHHEYDSIIGEPFHRVSRMPLLLGKITHPAVPKLFFGSAD